MSRDQNKTIKLSNALCVSRLITNSIPVSEIFDNNSIVVFDKHKAFVYNQDDKLILEGTRVGDSFYVDYMITDDAKSGKFIVAMAFEVRTFKCSGCKKFAIWKKMLHGLPKILDKVMPDCEVCAKGKQATTSFRTSDKTKETKTLKLFFSDLCNPMRVKSFGGARYLQPSYTITLDGLKYFF